jgi:hypothetical protein
MITPFVLPALRTCQFKFELIAFSKMRHSHCDEFMTKYLQLIKFSFNVNIQTTFAILAISVLISSPREESCNICIQTMKHAISYENNHIYLNFITKFQQKNCEKQKKTQLTHEQITVKSLRLVCG